MKILIVNTDLDIGGGENSLIHFLNYFDYKKYSVDLGILQPKLSMVDRLNSNVNLIKLYEKPKLNEYDVAIGYKQGKSTSFVANKVKAKKKIAIFRHGTIKYTGIRKYIYGNQYKKIHWIVALNEDTKEKLSKHFNISLHKIKVIGDIFDREDFFAKSKEYDLEKKDETVITTVSRIVPLKKIELIPEIGKKLKEKNVNFKWYILGDYKDKKYFDSIVDLTKKYNLENNIFYMGNVENPMPYYKISDLYVQTSQVDCLPRSVIEALIMKVPVLSTDTVGGKTLIKPNVNGQLCKINNVEDIFDKLFYMVENIEEIKEKQPDYILDNEEILNQYYELF